MAEPSGGILRWPDGSLSESQLHALVGPGAPFELVEEIDPAVELAGANKGAQVFDAASRVVNQERLMARAQEAAFSGESSTITASLSE